MFGESNTGESPRVASPWEALIDTPPSPKFVPKLVPEAEEGNVEYKLQLLSPSPARFARLVTQLKWRLLEGGGQAYYELGVADSGALIGLPRSDLERTLETLECMAGEIGASVIVVKEIEVPKGMHVLGGDKAGLYAGEAGKRRWLESESESTTTDEDGSQMGGETLFSMDPETDVDPALTGTQFSIDLEISTVYKPRPMRSRSPASAGVQRISSTSPTATMPPKPKWNTSKKKPWIKDSEQDSTGPQGQTKQQVKALHRRQVRDRRREEKMKVLAANADASVGSKASAELVKGLESLHVTVDPLPVAVPAPALNLTSHSSYSPSSTAPLIDINSSASTTSSVSSTVAHTIHTELENEPRLIVEALVVRKLSLEEAFLDFGGFSLI